LQTIFSPCHRHGWQGERRQGSSVGEGVLEDAAVTAVRTWEFKPTMVNGQAVQVITTIPVIFTLE
jgi:TonB family protein